MLTLLLIRHAETKANKRGELIGRTDSPLSTSGKQQCEALMHALKHLQIDHIYASPLERCRQTILPLALKLGKPIETYSALEEIHFGDFEGKSFKYINAYFPEEVKRMIVEKNTYTYPNGESLIKAHNRGSTWLREEVLVKNEGTILIVAHGGTIRSLLSELLGGNHELHWHFKIDHGSITKVTVEEGFAVLEKLNDTSHLLSHKPLINTMI